MIPIRKKLVDELKAIIQKDEFEDIFYLLDSGNYAIDLILEQTFQTEYEIQSNIPFGYIYNHTFFENREDYFEHKKSLSKNITAEISLIAEDIANLSGRLESLYWLKLFSKIEDILYDDMENRQNCDVGVFNYITLKVNGIKVLGLDSEDHEEGIDKGLTNKQLILENLPNLAQFKDITEQHWYKNLSIHSRNLIKVGTKNLHLNYLGGDKSEIPDYSPLLLDFLKAVENEIIEHYKKYIQNLKIIAYDFLNKYDSKKKPSELIKTLLIISKSLIVKNKFNKIRSLYNFHHILKVFALRKNSENINISKSYLPVEKLNYLNKESVLIDYFPEMNIQRNNDIHDKIVESEIEFLILYQKLSFALELLAELNT